MWFCETKEAKKQMKICEENKCEGCRKCIWIGESANAMIDHGKIIETEHPLYNQIKDTFNGIEIN